MNKVPERNEQQLAEGVETWFSGVGELQRELAVFVAGRLQRDSEAIRETIASADFTEAVAAQTRWFNQTVADYGSEAAKVVELMARQGASLPGNGGDADRKVEHREAEAPEGVHA